jgi:hypothetical protein
MILKSIIVEKSNTVENVHLGISLEYVKARV